jgi:hypothetical protein
MGVLYQLSYSSSISALKNQIATRSLIIQILKELTLIIKKQIRKPYLPLE